MTEQSTANWVGGDVNVLLSWSLDQHRMVVTEELLRVAGFLATFAGLSFTVYLVTDPTYRDEFRTDVASELREASGVRAAYRWASPGNRRSSRPALAAEGSTGAHAEPAFQCAGFRCFRTPERGPDRTGVPTWLILCFRTPERVPGEWHCATQWALRRG
jgi:hypothetical protein